MESRQIHFSEVRTGDHISYLSQHKDSYYIVGKMFHDPKSFACTYVGRDGLTGATHVDDFEDPKHFRNSNGLVWLLHRPDEEPEFESPPDDKDYDAGVLDGIDLCIVRLKRHGFRNAAIRALEELREEITNDE